MSTSELRKEKDKELNYVLKTLFLRRELDNLSLVSKSNRCKSIIDLFSLVLIKSEASKLHSFEIGLVNTLKKLICSNSNKKNATSITLNEFNTFWLETPEEERHSFESTIAALPHPTSLSDINTLNAVDSEAEFNHVMRIILELEDQDMIMRLFKGLNINSIEKILSMSYEELWSLSLTLPNNEISLCLEWGDMLLIEQLKEFIKYSSKVNKEDMRKNLIKLNWNDFQDFLDEPGKERYKMSNHLESITNTQRKFPEKSTKSLSNIEDTNEIPKTVSSSLEELKVDLLPLSNPRSLSMKNHSTFNLSTQSPLVPKKLFTSKENLLSSSTSCTSVLVPPNQSNSSSSLSMNISVAKIPPSTPKSVFLGL